MYVIDIKKKSLFAETLNQAIVPLMNMKIMEIIPCKSYES